jgi:hypothetical protein
MTWALIVWVAATIGFIILVNNVGVDETRADCLAEATSQFERDLCDTGTSLAGAAWTVIAVVLGFIGFCILTVIWFATRPRRHCPACGRDVKKGRTVCKCGFDFAAAALPPRAPPGTPLPPPAPLG